MYFTSIFQLYKYDAPGEPPLTRPFGIKVTVSPTSRSKRNTTVRLRSPSWVSTPQSATSPPPCPVLSRRGRVVATFKYPTSYVYAAEGLNHSPNSISYIPASSAVNVLVAPEYVAPSAAVG